MKVPSADTARAEPIGRGAEPETSMTEARA